MSQLGKHVWAACKLLDWEGFEQPGLVKGAMAGSWNQMFFRVPSNPNYSVVL